MTLPKTGAVTIDDGIQNIDSRKKKFFLTLIVLKTDNFASSI